MRPNNEYYFLTFEEHDKAGVAYAPKELSFDLLDFEECIQSWTPITFQIRDGEFADFQGNDLGWRLCSFKLKGILENYLTDIDKYQWLEAWVTRNSESKDYYILHFERAPKLLDNSKTKYVSRKDNVILQPFFDFELIGERKVFTYDGGFNETVVHNDVMKELQENCSGVYMHEAQSDPGSLI